MSKGTDIGFEVTKGIMRALVDVSAHDGEFHERLREDGVDPTEHFQKMNDIMQGEGVARAFHKMLSSRLISPTKLEHDFETLEDKEGVSPMLAKLMLATESARSAAHFKSHEPACQKAVGRSDRRRGAGSAKRRTK